MIEVDKMLDRLAARIKRASDILYPLTFHADIMSPQERAINDAFNVLQWGKTLAEEAAEAAGGKDDRGSV